MFLFLLSPAKQPLHSSGTSGSKRWEFEGLVVKFVTRPARDASVMDLAMQLQTNVRAYTSRALGKVPPPPPGAEACLLSALLSR